MAESPKLVYIAHPINADTQAEIQENMDRVLEICESVHTEDVIPSPPYLVALEYLDDNDPDERCLGMQANREYFRRGVFDEIWLCGPRISPGMKQEIKLAQEKGINIRCYNKELEPELTEILNTLNSADDT